MFDKIVVRGSSVVALALVAVVLGGVGRATAALVYDNGSINGQVAAYTIGDGYSVSDSFTSGGAFNLTGAQVGLWAVPEYMPYQTNWSIGTTPFASNVSYGNFAQFTLAYLGSAGGGNYALYSATLPLSGEITAGTYYLTIGRSGPNPHGQAVFWDDNNGPSSAYDSALGPLAGYSGPGSNSESFQIYGSPVTAPEPATLTLLGSALLGLGIVYRRRRRAGA